MKIWILREFREIFLVFILHLGKFSNLQKKNQNKTSEY